MINKIRVTFGKMLYSCSVEVLNKKGRKIASLGCSSIERKVTRNEKDSLILTIPMEFVEVIDPNAKICDHK